MKKVIILLCLFYSVTQNLFCQEWIRYYGQGQNAIGNSVISDYDNGYIISSSIYNYKYVWILKTDVNGNILWDNKIGNGTFSCWSGNIEKTSDGGGLFVEHGKKRILILMFLS